MILLDADLVASRYKSGGFSYIPEEGPLPVVQKLNSTTKKIVSVGMPCRALDKVDPDLQPFCFSYVDPDRPGWYLIHRVGHVAFEPEYDPTNPDTFDVDASIISRYELFFPGFASFESLGNPNHFGVSKDGFLQLSEFEDTLEFKNSASSTIMRFDRKGELSYICLFTPLSLCRPTVYTARSKNVIFIFAILSTLLQFLPRIIHCVHSAVLL